MKSSFALLLGNVVRNIVAGVRLALFLPVTPLHFRTTPADFAALFVCNALIALAGGVIREGTPGMLNTAALPALLAQVPVLLIACLVIAAIMRRREALVPLAVALIAADPVFEVAGTALDLASSLELPALAAMVLGYAYLAWAFAVAIRALVVITGWRAPASRYAAGVVSLLFAVFLLVMPRADLWITDDGADDFSPPPAIFDEQTFHRQQALLEESLAALEPERPGVEDLYFVGFAPYAPQDVFVRELAAVRTLFDRRFGTAGRSLALANSAETLATLPIASATNLRAALEGVARVMNPDEDVLFLYLTSHGDARHALAVEFPPLQLQQLTPVALARMLHDAGFKWKVLVVSACYSGGYIEPLKDANTLIMTAADATSTSFGCQSGRDYTYFGGALFRDALPSTYSFAAAFETARRLVAEREQAERLAPSSPQMFIGAAIRGKLAALERRLGALQ